MPSPITAYLQSYQPSGANWAACPATLTHGLASGHFLSEGDPLVPGVTGGIHLGSIQVEKIASPSAHAWKPHVYAHRSEVLIEGDDLRNKADILAGHMQRPRARLGPRGIPDNTTCMLLSGHHFNQALHAMGYASDATVFRQPNGILLIDSDRAFLPENSYQTRSVLTAALNAGLIGTDMLNSKGHQQILPVRLHPDERYLTPEESTRTFADQLFREALFVRGLLRHLSPDQDRQMTEFCRLSGQAYLTDNTSLDTETLVKKLIGFTLVQYAGLLEHKINPLLKEPLKLTDYIKDLNVIFGAEPDQWPILAHVELNLSEGLNVPRTMLVVASDHEGYSSGIDHGAILHELVHIATDEKIAETLIDLFAEHNRITPVGQGSSAICDALLRAPNFTYELLTETLRYSLVEGGTSASRRPTDSMASKKFVKDGKLDIYKAAWFTAQEGLNAQGDAFMAPFLGKTQADDQAGKQLADRLLPQLNQYCLRAMRKIKSLSEWS